MPDFTAKMHQIRFRLGLHPRPSWGSSERSPDPLAGFKARGGAGKDLWRGRRLEKEDNVEERGLGREWRKELGG